MQAVLLRLLTTLLVLCWLPLAFAVMYLLGLTAAAALPRRQMPPTRRVRTFRIVIPAHNEELVLAPVLRRLTTIQYPRTAFEVVVIADNCSDRTAQVARDGGAVVLERFDPIDRGKGHALAYAFSALRNQEFDAYVVLDADTLVDVDLLDVFNRYLEADHRVIQAHYDVLDPFETRRTALMYVAFAIFNYVRPLGRRMLGLSTGLKGNGMCFAKPVIDRFAWNAFSLAEDIEYTTTLMLNREQIVFAPEAHIAAQMPQARGQATSQRLRWEAGRLVLARRDGLHLIRHGLQRLDLRLLDWGIDLVIPPLAVLTLGIIGGTAASSAIALYMSSAVTRVLLGAWTTLSASLVLFVIAAMVVARLPWQAYRALLSAPGFVAWKLWMYVKMLTGRVPQGWVRTERTHIFEK